MPTVRGWTLALVSIVLLSVSVVRDELGVAVWAGGMLLLVLVVIVTGLVGRGRLAARRAAFDAELDRTLVEAGERVPVLVTTPAVRLLPGFVLEHSVRLEFGAVRALSGSSIVEAGGRSSWHLTASERGDYRARASHLVLRDALGLTRSCITDERSVRLLVLSPPIDLSPPLPARRGGDRAVEPSAQRVRSNELREVRPYVPGDDIRRLSWKHLAAHDELLIRVGEHVPPARGDVFCRIDDRVPPGSSREATGDALMAALRAVVREATAHGIRLLCRFPGERAPIPVRADPLARTSSEPDDARAAAVLAGFLPGETVGRGTRREPPETPRGPGAAPGGAEITITARDDSRAPYVVSVAEMLRPPARREPLWRRLLYRGVG
jgi:uncharacterized protein (DUF58 family)